MKAKYSIAIVLTLILGMGALALTQLHQTVTINIDGQRNNATVWAWTVADALTSANVKVTEGDFVEPPLEVRVPVDGIINIERAFWVSITADGETHSVWTTEKQPETVLQLAGLELAPNDILLWNGRVIAPEDTLPQNPSHSLQIQRAAQISIFENGQNRQISSTQASLGAALWDEGIYQHSSDRLEPESATPLGERTIAAELQRAREVEIQESSNKVQARVLATNVGEALAQAGIPLQGLDYSIPPEDAPIPISNTIQIIRVQEEVILETEPLPFGYQTQPLENVELDTQQVVQVGEYGTTAKRVRVVYENGVEVSRQTEDEWVAREPKPRIVGYGTQINIRTLQTADGPIEYWRAVEVYGSTYSPCRSGGDKCYPNTSSGKPVQKGVIAVTLDWYRYMQGLPAYVPNYGFGTIEDVGGGLPDRHWIDLGYSDDDWEGWGGWMTIYFLTPVPANIMWILE